MSYTAFYQTEEDDEQAEEGQSAQGTHTHTQGKRHMSQKERGLQKKEKLKAQKTQHTKIHERLTHE